MTKKNSKEVKQFEVTKVNANSENHEIRSFFVNTAIQTINYMGNKAYNGRIRDKESEKIKIQQLKLIINACNVGNRILKDRCLEDYEKDLEILKHGLFIDVDGSDDIVELSPSNLKEIKDLDEKLERLKCGDDAK